jgi:subtilisin family serine protease/uncharacterized protein (DUF2141 family)
MSSAELIDAFGSGDSKLNEFLKIYGLAPEGLPDPGGDLTNAFEIGALDETQTLQGFVGNSDPVDVYTFSLDSASDFVLGLTNLSADADVELIQDANINGEIEGDEIIGFSENFGTNPERIEALLVPGDYAIRVRQFEGDTNYDLNLSATPTELPADGAGGSLAQARDLGTLTESPQSLTDFVGGIDLNDYYRFNLNRASIVELGLTGLSADADIELIQDINGNGIDEADEVLDVSRAAGTNPENIETELEAGNYFIRVFPFTGDTFYNLSASARPQFAGGGEDTAGDTLAQARDVGVLNAPQTFNESVATDSDPADVYRFTLDTPSSVQASLTGLSGDADIEVVQDLNGNGAVDDGEFLSFSEQTGTLPEQINTLLDAGTYFLRVLPFESQTNYTLDLSATPSQLPGDGVGNTLATAQDLGVLDQPQTVSEFVGSIDINDYYRFSLDQARSVNIALEDLSADADVQLIQDLNGNGMDEADEVLQLSDRPGIAPENIALDLNAGNYFIRVFQFRGDAFYNLNVSAPQPEPPPTDSVGNTLATATDLGVLNAPQTLNEAVATDSDPADVYRFTLDTPSTVQANLTGLSGDADIQLIQDLNGNGEADNPEFLTFSEELGTTPEQIETLLDAGTYFLRVLPFESQTNYTLDLSATPSQLPSDGAGNSLATARDLGVLAGLDQVQTPGDFVGSIDINDYYRFTLDTTSQVSLRLEQLSADADLELIQDLNGDGVGTPDEIIARSQAANAQPEAIDDVFDPGTYYIRVFQFQGDTGYNLTASADPIENIPPDSAGNTLAEARVLGSLRETQTFTDFVGRADRLDYYRFTLDQASDFQLSLNGLTADANVVLFQDDNGDGIFTRQTETVTASTEGGTAAESIALDGLNLGTYYVLVEPFDMSETNYNLSLSAKPQTVQPPQPTGDRFLYSGFGLVNAAGAVANTIGRGTFPDQPDFQDDPDFPANPEIVDYGLNRVKAPEVWAQSYTGEDIVVAVIDTGVNLKHPDLQNNIWVNADEIPKNGLDDDGNGYIDDFNGYDFADRDSNPEDDRGHGTHVAGTIAAERNGLGIAGVAPDATIMPLKVFSSEEGALDSDIVEAIDYAVANGAHAINMSLGSHERQSDNPESFIQNQLETYTEPLQRARQAGVSVVISSGNERDEFNFLEKPGWPARINENGLAVAVGAVSRENYIVDFSNPAREAQNFVSAPGQEIYSSFPSDFVLKDEEGNIRHVDIRDARFAKFQGTSMAAPHVAGVTALMVDALYEATGRNPQTDPLTGAEVDRIYATLNQTADSSAILGYEDAITGEPILFQA